MIRYSYPVLFLVLAACGHPPEPDFYVLPKGPDTVQVHVVTQWPLAQDELVGFVTNLHAVAVDAYGEDAATGLFRFSLVIGDRPWMEDPGYPRLRQIDVVNEWGMVDDLFSTFTQLHMPGLGHKDLEENVLIMGRVYDCPEGSK